jgi:hypothetical protein
MILIYKPNGERSEARRNCCTDSTERKLVHMCWNSVSPALFGYFLVLSKSNNKKYKKMIS